MKRRIIGCLLALTCFTATVCTAETVFGTGEVLPMSQPAVYARIDARVAEWFVGMGDQVHEGDVLMRLESDELNNEVEQLEYELQTLQKEILNTETHSQYTYRQLRDEKGELRFDVNTDEPLMGKYSNEITIRAPSAGRIMAVYMKPGDDALAVYREYGSVAMLSTDGCMKVELQGIEGVSLAYDQTVRVIGDGFEIEGTIIRLVRHGMEATVLVRSDLLPMDAPVTVKTEDGTLVGTGVLEINKPMAVSAYGGTIKGLAWNVQVGTMLERYDVMARIEWNELPLYLDNENVLREYTKKKIELEKAKEKLEKLMITAPCDGKIISVDVGQDEAVKAGTAVIRMLEVDAGMQIVLKVDELDILSVKTGQSVDIEVDALPGEKLQGVVQKIAPLGHTESAVTTYDVYVTLTGERNERILGGMNVSGEIQVGTSEK